VCEIYKAINAIVQNNLLASGLCILRYITPVADSGFRKFLTRVQREKFSVSLFSTSSPWLQRNIKEQDGLGVQVCREGDQERQRSGCQCLWSGEVEGLLADFRA